MKKRFIPEKKKRFDFLVISRLPPRMPSIDQVPIRSSIRVSRGGIFPGGMPQGEQKTKGGMCL
jgi:hypothetical protein